MAPARLLPALPLPPWLPNAPPVAELLTMVALMMVNVPPLLKMAPPAAPPPPPPPLLQPLESLPLPPRKPPFAPV